MSRKAGEKSNSLLNEQLSPKILRKIQGPKVKREIKARMSNENQSEEERGGGGVASLN